MARPASVMKQVAALCATTWAKRLRADTALSGALSTASRTSPMLVWRPTGWCRSSATFATSASSMMQVASQDELSRVRDPGQSREAQSRGDVGAAAVPTVLFQLLLFLLLLSLLLSLELTAAVKGRAVARCDGHCSCRRDG